MTALEQARAKANALQFGTAGWEAAMQVVRDLVDAENAATDFGTHTSIDGDIYQTMWLGLARAAHQEIRRYHVVDTPRPARKPKPNKGPQPRGQHWNR